MTQVDDCILANQLGDLTVMADPPAKMWKALATISARAHQAYWECSGMVGGAHDKCLFMSLAVRDFLVRIGFADATVRSCFLYINAEDNQGNEIWSVGIGAPGQVAVLEKFNGHAVCCVPSLSLLIDTTIYQAIRPHWLGAISGMVAIKYHEPWAKQRMRGCPSIAGAEIELPDRRMVMLWLDRPEVHWKRSLDFRQRNERRRYVTKAMIDAFGSWSE